ncbi:aminopeptidase [Pseudonocardia sichuanensis]
MSRLDTDPRWGAVGRVLVEHSTRVRPGERVMIAMGEVGSYPLARAVFQAVVEAGGYPQVQFLSEELRHAILRHGDADQLAWVPEIEAHGMSWADVHIALRGGFDLDVHADIPSERLAVNQAAQGRISTLRWQHTRWALARVPNQAFADQAGVSLERVTEMFFAGCLLDWDEAATRWREWANRAAGGRTVEIRGPGVDLRFSIEGRTWVVADGRTNMPDGELMTAPVTDTVDGWIAFENPAVLGGRRMHDLRLRWEKGVLVEATASTNEDYLRSVLATDEGATRIGEFGIGTNPFIDLVCDDILIDEKINGTVHVALGRAYPECGGDNRSAIHWDIVKDLRAGGEVLLDGRPVVDGRGPVL